MAVSRRKSASKACWCYFPTSSAASCTGRVRFPELESAYPSVHRYLSTQRSGCGWPLDSRPVVCGIFRRQWIVRELGCGHPNKGAAGQEAGKGDRGDPEVPEPQAREQEDRSQAHTERLALYQQSMQGTLLELRRQRREEHAGAAEERAQRSSAPADSGRSSGTTTKANRTIKREWRALQPRVAGMQNHAHPHIAKAQGYQ
jgi:hypothetical protein